MAGGERSLGTDLGMTQEELLADFEANDQLSNAPGITQDASESSAALLGQPTGFDWQTLRLEERQAIAPAASEGSAASMAFLISLLRPWQALALAPSSTALRDLPEKTSQNMTFSPLITETTNPMP